MRAISWENPPKWQELPVMPLVYIYCYSSKSTKIHRPIAKYVNVSSENKLRLQISLEKIKKSSKLIKGLVKNVVLGLGLHLLPAHVEVQYHNDIEAIGPLGVMQITRYGDVSGMRHIL